MRILAIILNIILIVLALILTIDEFPLDAEEALYVLVFFLAPITSLISLSFDSKDNWISLYLERRKMEEKVKIKKLKENNP